MIAGGFVIAFSASSRSFPYRALDKLAAHRETMSGRPH